MIFLVCCSGTKVSVWDLKSGKEVIFYPGCLVTQALTAEDFLVLSHHEVPMNNWHRVKRKFSTLDVVDVKSKELGVRLAFEKDRKILVHKGKIVFVHQEVCSLWEMRKIPVLWEGVSMTAFFQKENLAIVGSSEGAVYFFDLNSFELCCDKDVHEAEIFQIEVIDELIISAGFDEKIIVSSLNGLNLVLEIPEPGLCRFVLQKSEVLTLSCNGNLQVWNLTDGSLVKTITINVLNTQSHFNGVCLFDETLIVTSKKMGVLVDGVKEHERLSGLKPSCLASLGKFFAVGCCDGPIFYCDLKGSHVSSILDNKDEIKSLSFHHDGKFLMYSVSNVFRIWSFGIRRHVFNFEAKFASFVQGIGIKCCFCSFDFKIKVLEIRKEDMANVSRKMRFLMMFKRKFKII
jgi:WD40 repeat protein